MIGMVKSYNTVMQQIEAFITLEKQKSFTEGYTKGFVEGHLEGLKFFTEGYEKGKGEIIK